MESQFNAHIIQTTIRTARDSGHFTLEGPIQAPGPYQQIWLTFPDKPLFPGCTLEAYVANPGISRKLLDCPEPPDYEVVLNGTGADLDRPFPLRPIPGEKVVILCLKD